MKTRIITAVVISLICIPIIYFGNMVFKIAVGLLALLAFKEILSLKELKDMPISIKIISCILMLSILYIYPLKICIPIVMAILFIPTIFYQNKYKTSDFFKLLSWIIIFGLFFNFLIEIRDKSLYLLIYLLSISIFNEIFALFCGMAFGKHKLCKEISPNKTIEGSIGGLIIGTVLSVIIYNYYVNTISIATILMSIILSVLGQIGDLIFSKIKRENNIKDFSNLLPGHGGVLDRLDSFMLIVYGYTIIEYIFNILN